MYIRIKNSRRIKKKKNMSRENKKCIYFASHAFIFRAAHFRFRILAHAVSRTRQNNTTMQNRVHAKTTTIWVTDNKH